MHPGGYGQQILIVDNDASVRSLLSALLTYEGFNVVQSGNGLDALQELKTQHFDLVISDYHMPGLNGIQLLAICRHVWPETPVVIVSGEDSDWRDRAIREGAHACARKPYERAQLITLVREVVMEKRSARIAPQEVRA